MPSIPGITDIKVILIKLCQKITGVRDFFWRYGVVSARWLSANLASALTTITIKIYPAVVICMCLMPCTCVELQVLNGVILAVSVMGNHGTFTKPWREIVKDMDFLYPIGYLTVIILGLMVHEFFYSLIVSCQQQISPLVSSEMVNDL